MSNAAPKRMGRRITRKPEDKPAAEGVKLDAWTASLNYTGLQGNGRPHYNKNTRMGGVQDRTMYGAWRYSFSQRGQLDAMYTGDTVAARIVEQIPRDCVKKGVNVEVPGELTVVDDDGDAIPNPVNSWLEEWGVLDSLRKAHMWARLYGGGALIMLVDDGQDDPSKPLDMSSIREWYGVQVVEAGRDGELKVKEYNTQLGNGRQLNEAETYWYTPGSSGTVKLPDGTPVGAMEIHATRVVAIDGYELPDRMRRHLGGWGGSVLDRARPQVEGLSEANASLRTILSQWDTVAVKMHGYAEKIATPQGRETVNYRVGEMRQQSSTLRAMILDKEDDVQQVGGSMAGIAEAAGFLALGAASAGEMTARQLMGDDPGGLGTDDKAGRRFYAAVIEAKQNEKLTPAMRKLLTVAFACPNGPTRGQQVKGWTMSWPSFEDEDEGERAQVNKTQAETDAINISAGVYTAEEARTRYDGTSTDGTVVVTAKPTAPLIATEGDPTPGDAPPGEDVQKAALNGAQVASIAEIVQLVNTGNISTEQGEALILASFPVSPMIARTLATPATTAQQPEPSAQTTSLFDAESYTPPKQVQENARRALEVREGKPESQRGMTEVGIARARDLANGRALSLETVERMVAYFERHEVDKQGETWSEQGKGWQAWMGWGGDEGWSWAKRIVKQARAKMDPYIGIDDPNLPEHVRAYPESLRKMWVSVFNAVFSASDGDEARAFRAANAAVVD